MSTSNRMLTACTVALAVHVATPAAQKSTVEPVTSMSWLKEHLNDPGVVVIATDDDKAPFERGHIPTARFGST